MPERPSLKTASELLLRGIREYAIITLDPDGKILAWNEGAERISGFTAAEMLGKPCSLLHTIEHISDGKPQKILQIAREKGRAEDQNYRMRKDGTRIWASIVLTAIRDERGELIGFTEIIQDLTDRRRYEQAMRDQDALLRDSAARHRAVFDSALDGIVTIDGNGVIESVNPATERLFGYSASELVGRDINVLMPAPFQGEHEQYLQSYLKTGIKKIIGAGREVVGLRKDGSTFPMDLAVSEMSIGGRKMFTGLIHDISDRKEAEKERERLLASERAARAEAERASKTKDDFLAALSHELRTPLTPALLTVSLLERDRELPQRCRADIEVIRRNVEMEARLIDDLLDLTRVLNKKMLMEFENVDVHQILWNADRNCRTEDGIEVSFDLAATEHHTRGDPTRLQQVFFSILSNAHKFTPIGGRIRVHSFNPEPGKLSVEITDTGRGIEPTLLPRIFNAFEQGDPQTARGFGGLGLGLTISKAIIDAHAATLEAHSAGKGQGSAFKIELATIPPGVPASAGMSSPSTETRAPRRQAPPHPPGRRSRAHAACRHAPAARPRPHRPVRRHGARRPGRARQSLELRPADQRLPAGITGRQRLRRHGIRRRPPAPQGYRPFRLRHERRHRPQQGRGIRPPPHQARRSPHAHERGERNVCGVS